MTSRLIFPLLFSTLLFTVTCGGSSGDGALDVRRNLPDLVRSADEIVVGTVLSASGTRNLSRNPRDLTQDDPNHPVIGQDYAVQIETVLKGVAAQTLVVSLSKLHGASNPLHTQDKEFVPLVVGGRYMLFLQRAVGFPGSVYAVGVEPGAFRLTDRARVESRWVEASASFPETSAAEFISQVQILSRP